MTQRPVLLQSAPLPPEIEAVARERFELHPWKVISSVQDLQGVPDSLTAILVSMADKLTADVIAALPASVRVIATYSVGFDHIDLKAAQARGIVVLNTPDVLSVATAECSMALILAAARHIGMAERSLRAGQWRGADPSRLVGTQVSGRKLGIFGMGRIGRELAHMAKGFKMEVHYRNRSRLPAELEEGAIYHDNDASFLAVSEVLSLNAPGGDSTHHWLNAKTIAQLPKGAVVVNVARGTLVDDTALIAALRSGQVAAAGLDVFENEPNFNPEYLTLENAVLIPHVGSATRETRLAMGHLIVDGISAVSQGKIPANVVR